LAKASHTSHYKLVHVAFLDASEFDYQHPINYTDQCWL